MELDSVVITDSINYKGNSCGNIYLSNEVIFRVSNSKFGDNITKKNGGIMYGKNFYYIQYY